MSVKSDPNKYKWIHGDYCKRCWVEFVTLTDQERKNLAKRAQLIKQKQFKEKIQWKI